MNELNLKKCAKIQPAKFGVESWQLLPPCTDMTPLIFAQIMWHTTARSNNNNNISFEIGSHAGRLTVTLLVEVEVFWLPGQACGLRCGRVGRQAGRDGPRQGGGQRPPEVGHLLLLFTYKPRNHFGAFASLLSFIPKLAACAFL